MPSSANMEGGNRCAMATVGRIELSFYAHALGNLCDFYQFCCALIPSFLLGKYPNVEDTATLAFRTCVAVPLIFGTLS